mgnify:CR=1 FL=1
MLSAALFSLAAGLSPRGGTLPGLEGMVAGETRMPLPFKVSMDPPPCGPANECSKLKKPEPIKLTQQPEPPGSAGAGYGYGAGAGYNPAIELPTPTPAPCAECARVTGLTASALVNATIYRCLARCEARKGEVRSRLAAVNVEIRNLQTQQLAQAEGQRQRAEISNYKKLLSIAGGDESNFASAQVALEQAATTQQQLQKQSQQMEDMAREIMRLKTQLKAASLNAEPSADAQQLQQADAMNGGGGAAAPDVAMGSRSMMAMAL